MFLSALATGRAQTTNDSIQSAERLLYEKINFIGNLYHHTSNPVRLSHNRIRSVADATVGFRFSRGDFHDICQGARNTGLGVSISGLQNFGKTDVSGSISYHNTKDFGCRWNSTLFLTGSNPFILGDAISSDMLTERFVMSAAASHRITDRLTGALHMEYNTGSLSDQTDPRAKTSAIRFIVTPGVEYRLNQTHTIGLTGNVNIYRSDLSYAIVNNNNNHVYYLMKGMGDYFVRTSKDAPSYIRNYEGRKWRGSVQWLMSASGRGLANLLEISCGTNRETATDGGSSYTFKGGDYQRTDFGIYNRFRWQQSPTLVHNFSISASHYTDRGDWYDQKKLIDTEHGNKTYYEILNLSTVRKSNCSEAQFAYQADFLQNGIPHIHIKAALNLKRNENIQYEETMFRQAYSLIGTQLEAGKRWKIKKCIIYSTVGGHYTANAGKEQFSAVDNDIAGSYTAPAFEYESASHAGFNAELSAHIPAFLYGHATWIGMFAGIKTSFYTGASRHSAIYRSTSRTTLDTGLSLRF